MAKLTKNLADKANPKSTRYIIWDQALPGFGLVVQPTGTKSYCFQYRNAQGKSCRTTIGKHGVFTADSARKKAKDYQAVVNSGGDPLADKRAEKESWTVGELLDEYVQSAKFSEKTEITRMNDMGRIKRHLKPLLEKKIAEKLTFDQLRKAQKDIENGKTAKTVKTKPRGVARVTGGPGAARMAIRLLKSAFSWAKQERFISTNPTLGFTVAQDGQRDAVLSANDYKLVFSAIDDLESTLQVRSSAADAIRVIALTGARRNEIASLLWRYVKLDKGVIELPVNKHKTGKKTQQSRVIGLPTAAQAIISRQPGGEPDSFVFPPARGKGPISLNKPWRAIRKKAGVNPEIGLHSLRHSLATGMAENGSQAAHIMVVMGHRNIATSQKYIHIAQDRRADLAESAATGISAALNRSKSADVVKMR